MTILWGRLINKKQQDKARGTLRSSLIRRSGAKKKGQEEMMEPDKEPPQEQELQPEEQEDLEPQEEQNMEECELTADVSLLI